MLWDKSVCVVCRIAPPTCCVVHRCSNMRRAPRRYVCVLANVLLFAGWVALWEYRVQPSAGVSEGRGCVECGCVGQTVRSRNSSLLLHLPAIKAAQRPLLVRFDWYSRKQTPVHIG